MQLNSDRFIPDSSIKIEGRARIKNRNKNKNRRLQFASQIDTNANNGNGNGNGDRQVLQDRQNDTQVNKLYRMLVLQDEGDNCGNEENYMQYNSMKTIKYPLQQQSQYQPNKYQYLSKLGLDMSKVQLGPTVISKPDRILQALSLSDNFYLNLLDCSADSVLAVGLSRGIYLWSPSGSISRIRQAPDISCIQWNPSRPDMIACGTKTGGLQVWDAQQNMCLAQFPYHQSRVGSIAWQSNPYCLLSGSKDTNIFQFDIRVGRKIGKFRFHEQQICALKVQSASSGANSDYFASGSNDKNLVVWNTRMKNPQLVYKHSAAIKGIAWHPVKSGILASGGGTEDRCIKIWNTSANQLVKSIDTGSQVCNLMYIKDGQNLISTHGFNKFETNIWQSSTMTKKISLVGHNKRVLYLAAQSNGQSIITGAGDQTIRFWKLKQNKKKDIHPEIQDRIMTIR